MGGQIIGSAPWIREIKSDAPVTMSRGEIRSSSPVAKRNLSFLRDQPDTVGSSPPVKGFFNLCKGCVERAADDSNVREPLSLSLSVSIDKFVSRWLRSMDAGMGDQNWSEFYFLFDLLNGEATFSNSICRSNVKLDRGRNISVTSCTYYRRFVYLYKYNIEILKIKGGISKYLLENLF